MISGIVVVEVIGTITSVVLAVVVGSATAVTLGKFDGVTGDSVEVLGITVSIVSGVVVTMTHSSCFCWVQSISQ